MKSFIKLIIATGLVLFFNVNSFASVDLAAYGGYMFSGDAEVAGESADISGPQFGVKGHYNIELSPSVGLGLGAYYQYTKIKVDVDYGETPKISRNAAGVDINLIFSMPTAPDIFPYLRANYSFYDKLSGDTPFGETVSGHGFGIGAGLEFAITPVVRIFGEFMYEMPSYKKYGYTLDVSAAAFNIGLKCVI